MSAMVVTYLFLKYKLKSTNIFINIGVCGAKDENIHIGDVFFCVIRLKGGYRI